VVVIIDVLTEQEREIEQKSRSNLRIHHEDITLLLSTIQELRNDNGRLISELEIAMNALDDIEDQCNSPHDVKIAEEALKAIRK
jgi:hypothetical protein